METGLDGNDQQFKVGDSCNATRLDAVNVICYMEKVFDNENKEEFLKYRAKVTAKPGEKTTKATTKPVTEKGTI